MALCNNQPNLLGKKFIIPIVCSIYTTDYGFPKNKNHHFIHTHHQNHPKKTGCVVSE